MFAVIKTGGKQYTAQEGDILQIEKLDAKEGQKITFDQVLLVEDNGKTLIGTPLVENAVVKAVVIENFKDRKVIVFKKKRRKQYKRKKGHRQELTKVQIEKIISGIEVSPKKQATPEEPKKEPQKTKTVAKKTTPKAGQAKAKAKAAPKAKVASKTEKPKASPPKKAAAGSKARTEKSTADKE